MDDRRSKVPGLALLRDTPWPVWVVLLLAAFSVHVFVGDGGDFVSGIYRDRRSMEALGEWARHSVTMNDATLEVTMDDSEPIPSDQEALTPKQIIEKKDPTKPEEKKAPTPEVKKPPEEKKVVVKTEKAPEELPLRVDKRIAVKQHVKPNQEDNPNAKQIADDANKVDEETRATQTSHDRDDKDPTPGGNHPGSEKAPGDSSQTKIADSDEHRGEPNRAPGEKGHEQEVKSMPAVAKLNAPTTQTPPSPRAGGDGRPQGGSQTTDTPPATVPTVSPVVDGPNGWAFNPFIQNGAAGTTRGPGITDPKDPRAGQKSPLTILGLGQNQGPGASKLNLSHSEVLAVVGIDEIRKERVAEGERRKSEHRGSWQASGFEHWRNAIENYVTSVKPGNQTSLNAARVPFASYLNDIHNRIHPIFADSFLGSLDSRPATDPLNDQTLITRVEIVLTKDGKIVKMGIVNGGSGKTQFDIAALDSVERASPFGKAPAAILSPDGNVYLHWEFHRNEQYACSTMNARPFIIKVDPTAPPVRTPPPNTPSKQPTDDRSPPTDVRDTRHG